MLNRSTAPAPDAGQTENHARYHKFIENIADGVYETDLKGNFTFFNPAFCRIFAVTPGKIQGSNYNDFMDAQSAHRAYQHFSNVFTTGEEATDIEWEIIRNGNEKRILEISANLIFNRQGEKAGFRGVVRDVTEEKKANRINRILFRIAQKLPLFSRLDDLLAFIIQEVKTISGVEGASVILLDEKTNEFYFRAVTYDDIETGLKIQEIRFPADQGVAGQVHRTGKPLMVPDTSQNPFFYQQVDRWAEYHTRNMLDVPIFTQDRMIGVLCTVNKKEGVFDSDDTELLNAIAAAIAYPIENIKINEALTQSYQEVKILNRAKDRVINHLSHELKTPVSVLSASLGVIARTISDDQNQKTGRALKRMQRNLNRLIEMQYRIEDILRQGDYRTFAMLSTLLDVCADELEALAAQETGNETIGSILRTKIEATFGPRQAVNEQIQLDHFVKHNIPLNLVSKARRDCHIETHLESTEPVFIPPEVLKKVLTGLIRNAVENTPDKGRIQVHVRNASNGPELEIKDYGIGITAENQPLIFQSNFSARETIQYTSGIPYQFNTGGRGFDLLRMKIFSERFGFTIEMASERCRYLPDDSDLCPGDIDFCRHCRTVADCENSGGAAFTIRFPGNTANI